jgi:hypothetical protein
LPRPPPPPPPPFPRTAVLGHEAEQRRQVACIERVEEPSGEGGGGARSDGVWVGGGWRGGGVRPGGPRRAFAPAPGALGRRLSAAGALQHDVASRGLGRAGPGARWAACPRAAGAGATGPPRGRVDHRETLAAQPGVPRLSVVLGAGRHRRRNPRAGQAPRPRRYVPAGGERRCGRGFVVVCAASCCCAASGCAACHERGTRNAVAGPHRGAAGSEGHLRGLASASGSDAARRRSMFWGLLTRKGQARAGWFAAWHKGRLSAALVLL